MELQRTKGRRLSPWLISISMALVGGCGGGAGEDASGEGETTGQPETSASTATTPPGDGDGDDSVSGDGDGDPASGDGDGDDSASGDGDGDGDGDTDTEGGTKFDMAPVPDNGDDPLPPSCEVVDEMNAVGECEQSAPPDSFEPDTQWSYTGPPGFEESISTPLVLNLTDDNEDGAIDLCDIPDVLVVAGPGNGDTPPSKIVALNGETGEPQFEFAELVQFAATPAAGDIDNDGLPEIIAVGPGGSAPLMAFEHDGTLKWTSNTSWSAAQSSAIALADVDADGDVEIIAGARLYDHEGTELWARPDKIYSASTAADLDMDGELEILTSGDVYRADGSLFWTVPGIAAGGGLAAHPQVADVDNDGEPEVLYAANDGLWLLEGDGTVIWSSFRPTGEANDWNRPVNIHDLDGDGQPEFGASAPQHYGVFEFDQSELWSSGISDPSGQAGGTAFDFLGAGTAQTVYASEDFLHVFDDLGSELLNAVRNSGTVLEYPVVADIDNDGSAEILVVSNSVFGGQLPYTITAIRDAEDRWIQGRRIWNQHTYHVTNVREDGVIPQHEPPSWLGLNTFRTQAQIEGGEICLPEPEG